MEPGRTAFATRDRGPVPPLRGIDRHDRSPAGLANETKAPGWWQAYCDAVPDWFDVYVGLEAAATRMTKYESELVPGLFQTEAYARAIIRPEVPRPGDADRATRRTADDPPGNPATAGKSPGAVGRAARGRDRDARSAARRSWRHNLTPRRGGGATGRDAAGRAVQRGCHRDAHGRALHPLALPLNGSGTETEPDTVYSRQFTGRSTSTNPPSLTATAGRSQKYGRPPLTKTRHGTSSAKQRRR